jgi:hypothetical protein
MGDGDDFSTTLQRMLEDAHAKLEGRKPMDFLIDPTIITGEPDPEIAVRKLRAFMHVTCCEMTDSTGVNHCEHPPPPRPPLHRRLHWRISSWWAGLRMRVGSWIAGVDLDREDD